GLADFLLQVEELVEVGEEQAVLVESGNAAQQLAQEFLSALEALQVHDQIAQGDPAPDGAPCDVGVGAVDEQRGHALCGQLAQRPALQQCEAFVPQAAAQVAVAADEELAEAEQPQLLREEVGGEQIAEVAGAPFGRRVG